jgi:hypothetical protein
MVPVVRTKLAYDMLPTEHSYWDVLKIIPPSDEGGELMQAESRARMRAVMPYQRFVDTYAVLTADIITEVMYQNLRRQIDADDYQAAVWHDTTMAQNREIVRGAIYPILAHMLESGVLVPAVPL